MPSPMPFGDFKRKFKAYGVTIKSAGRGSHYKMSKVVGSETVVYVFPVKNNKVKHVYVVAARRLFELREQDGVTDDEFRKK